VLLEEPFDSRLRWKRGMMQDVGSRKDKEKGVNKKENKEKNRNKYIEQKLEKL